MMNLGGTNLIIEPLTDDVAVITVGATLRRTRTEPDMLDVAVICAGATRLIARVDPLTVEVAEI